MTRCSGDFALGNDVRSNIFMEQVLEREVPKEYKDIVLYDDYGKRVTNPEMLEAIAEAQEILADWLRSKEKWKH